jgi:hypothetical protein
MPLCSSSVSLCMPAPPTLYALNISSVNYAMVFLLPLCVRDLLSCLYLYIVIEISRPVVLTIHLVCYGREGRGFSNIIWELCNSTLHRATSSVFWRNYSKCIQPSSLNHLVGSAMDILFCCKLIVDSPVGLFYAILQKPKSLSCLYYLGQEVGRARNRPPINICLYTSHFAGSVQHWLFLLSFPRHLISRFRLIFFCAVVSSQNGIPWPPCGHGWGFSGMLQI